jgi:hypothetical protein
MRHLRPTLPFLLLVPAACGAGTSDAANNSAVRDSAGIEIVENTQPGWRDADAWRLSDAPTLTMGGTEGDSAHEFFRVAGAVRLSDGTIVVANSGTHELRYFEPDGELRHAIGRKGGGPGEFQGLAGLWRLPGDSLLAYDLMSRRLSLFDAAGRHARDISTAGSTPFAFFQITGRFRDGTYLAYMQSGMGPDMMDRPQGPARDSIIVFRLDSAGAVTDTLGVFPAGRVEVHHMEMLGRSFPMPVPAPFSPGTTVGAGFDIAYVGTNDTYEIRVLDPDGTLRRLIRKDQEPRAVTEADKEAYRTRMRELPSQNNPLMTQMRDAMAALEYPATLPAYGRLLVDADGNLWVSGWHVAEDEPVPWSVFGPEGRLLGTVTLPARFTVREIGADYVLGQMSDETEIERVVLYRLIKPAG